jgi:hypothetical protein
MSTVQEKRLTRRIPLQCSAIVRTDQFVTGGTVLNLGVAGCALTSNKKLLLGEHVGVELYLPDQKPALHVPVAKVRWINETRYGMEFLKFDGEHQARLEDLIKARAEPLSDPKPLPAQHRTGAPDWLHGWTHRLHSLIAKIRKPR